MRCAGSPSRSPVVGRDAGAEAARAVSDALDLIDSAEDIRIAVVDPDVGPTVHGEEQLAAMLARLSLPVTVEAVPGEYRSVADALLRNARAADADLMFAG